MTEATNVQAALDTALMALDDALDKATDAEANGSAKEADHAVLEKLTQDKTAAQKEVDKFVDTSAHFYFMTQMETRWPGMLGEISVMKAMNPTNSSRDNGAARAAHKDQLTAKRKAAKAAKGNDDIPEGQENKVNNAASSLAPKL